MPTRTYTEEEIQDLTDRVFLLKEQLENGKMHFAEYLIEDFKRSWEAIRIRPDGKVDPDSVDGRIRTATLAVQVVRERDKAKRAISLAEIQEIYFKQLFNEMGPVFDEMNQAGATPSHFARVMARDTTFIENVRVALP
jgi:hypothetical protein